MVLGTYQNSAGERARKYKVTPMSTLFNVTLLSESKTLAPDRRQTCTTSSSFHSDKTSLHSITVHKEAPVR